MKTARSAWMHRSAANIMPGPMRMRGLLLDVIEGDRSLFLRYDEVEWAGGSSIQFSASGPASATTYRPIRRGNGSPRKSPHIQQGTPPWRHLVDPE